MSADILIVDDETDIRELVAGILEDEGYETRMAANSDQCLAEIAHRRPSLVILDIWLRGSKMDGIEILQAIKKDQPDLPVLMFSGHGNIETAVQTIKLGAYDFIEKPFKAERLIQLVDRVLEAVRLRREVADLKTRGGEVMTDLICRSHVMIQLQQSIEKVAPTNSRVLIAGPSGSGKEVVARLIHDQSHRKAGPFVVLNAATLAPERLEIQLFGIEDGRMNSVKGERRGLLEQAHGGTLFLDEIADMPMETQGKILRVLVDQTFQRVGGTEKIKVDARIISSSSRDLHEEMANGRLREDLYHRLGVVPVSVPSLKERPEDIGPLARYFVERFSKSAGLPPRKIGEDAIATLQASSWPGNVRQLKNVIEQIMILATGDKSAPITANMVPADAGAAKSVMIGQNDNTEIMALPLREARERFEKEYLEAQINRFGGNISRTASFVGMERSALHRKLKTLGVSNGERKRSSE
ncbi:sigma-54 dependent transcriptional regulator [Sneathiella sp.]|uniref:nitrogen assimilation response regulator NtrX n=1 Tax=Sneathiella sp. TaxID=1964365 RepID=UPI00260C97FE|nr:sigma-54 dependent transcriptional regulator [Sneathiella sp.]MDF2368735.1 sigma-54 dependent transcriptional regulator [Sneathiella sp.]